MLEVFLAALLCVMVKMGDIVRVQLEPGIYLFCGAVVLSIICAALTASMARTSSAACSARVLPVQSNAEV